MSIKICCDFCDKPLEIVDDVDVVDRVEGFYYAKYYVTKTTKELNTTKIFPNLCENCAMKLDDALKYARGEWIKQLNISSRNAEINKDRREKLGTKG